MKNPLFWVLCVLLACAAAFNWYFLAQDTAPLLFDEHLNFQHAYHVYWQTGHFAWKDTVNVLRDLPSPLVTLNGGLFCAVFGASEDTAAFSIVVFLAVLVFSLFKLGETLYDRRTGFWAAVILLLFPSVMGMSRVFLSDLPAAAMATLCLCMLVKSEYFTRTAYSLFFGLAFAGLLMTKLFSFIFLLGPMAVYLLGAPGWSRRQFRLIGLAVVVCLAALLPFRVFTDDFVITYGKFIFGHAGLRTGPDLWARYLQLAQQYLILPYFFIVLMVAAPFFAVRVARGRLFLFSWVVIPYAFLTALYVFNAKEEPIFLFPCLPALALIISAAIHDVKAANTRNILLAVCVACGAITTYHYAFSPDPEVGSNLISSDLTNHNMGRYVIRNEDWKDKDLMEIFLRSAGRKPIVWVIPLFNLDRITRPLVSRAEVFPGPPNIFIDPYMKYVCSGRRMDESDGYCREKLAAADYILLREGKRQEIDEKGSNPARIFSKMRGIAQELGFGPVASFVMPDGSLVTVLRKPEAR